MKQRIDFIDSLKAFSIFLVVIGHALSLLWGDWKGSDCIFYQIIYTFHMPLFMFLSGFCAYNNNKIHLTTSYLKKIKALLLPYLVWAVIYCSLKNLSIFDDVFLKLHGGLWFLLCLFEIFLLYYPLQEISNKLNNKNNIVFDFIYYLIINIALVVIYKYFLKNSILDLVLNLDMFVIHFKYFIFGIIIKKHAVVLSFLLKPTNVIFAFFTYCFLVYLKLNNSFEYNSMLSESVIAISAIILFYNLFQKTTYNITIQNILSLLGRKTLEIYILHMLFFEGLSTLHPHIGQIKEVLILTIITSAFLSIINIYLCLLLSNFISVNRYLLFILFGK